MKKKPIKLKVQNEIVFHNFNKINFIAQDLELYGYDKAKKKLKKTHYTIFCHTPLSASKEAIQSILDYELGVLDTLYFMNYKRSYFKFFRLKLYEIKKQIIWKYEEYFVYPFKAKNLTEFLKKIEK